MRILTDADLLHALEPVVARNLDRHLAAARDWLPHEWLPWSRGRDFAGRDCIPWAPGQSPLGGAAQAALRLNLLAEDNLPSYHHELLARMGHAGAWGAWVRRWTAEEARHAAGLRDYALLSRAIDPVALERDRMTVMQAGCSAGGKDLLRSLAYAALQELATRVAHRNTGLAANDPAAEHLMARIAADENLHMLFYRDLMAEALAMAPAQGLIAIVDEVIGFKMPGVGIPGFMQATVLMADAGIYDLKLHRDEVLQPLLKHWHALSLPAAGEAAENAQRQLVRHLERLDLMAHRQEQRRHRRQQAWEEARPGPSPTGSSP
ncbi:MAG TPA: acyl-ACP desaturase [Burkholderiaceae bacterium]|nr:acyl-ACP desaturase [Burkholderiaceae bacterium]